MSDYKRGESLQRHLPEKILDAGNKITGNEQQF